MGWIVLSHQFSTVNDWNSGFQGSIDIQNDGSDRIDGWTISFTANFQITQLWGGRIVSQVGNRYTIEALSWNDLLQPGQKATFGFIGAPGGGPIAISGVELNGAPSEEPTPLPTVSIADTTVDEADGEAELTLTLDRVSDAPVTVSYQTATGTAGESDFSPASGTVTFAPGETAASITVPVTDDGEDEPNETFAVTLSSPSGATIGDGAATVTIVDNDEAPPPVVPTISVASKTVTEGDPSSAGAIGWFSTDGAKIVDETGAEVRLAGVNWFGGETTRMAPDGLFTRNWQDMMDQMEELGFNTIRMPFSNDMLRPGASPSDINYAVNPDLAGLTALEVFDKIVDYAGELGMRIILDNHRNAAGDGASGNGLWYGEGYTEAEWIADWEMLAARYADNPTVVGFDLSNEPHSASWGDGNAATDWRLGAEKAIDAIHDINPNVLVLVEGIGGDYWWGGNLKGVADAPIRLDQSDKLVYSPHAYPNSIYQQPWFSDPDFPDNLPDVWDTNWGYIAREGIAPVLVGEFGSRLADAKDVPWMEAFVPYLNEIGANWTYWSWNPNSGDTGGILDDDWRTPITAKLDLLEPALGGDLGAGTGEESPERDITVSVTLSEATTVPVTVSYATEDGTAEAGVDYEAASGTLTFAPGETEATITLTTLANRTDDGDRSFRVRLSDADGGEITGGSATITIVDDDDGSPVLPTLSIADLTIDEDGGSAQLVVELDAAATQTVTATVSASNLTADDDDYALNTSAITIAAGDDRAVIDIAAVEDSEVEGNETFTVSLSNLTGALPGDTSARVTIADDDTAPPPPGDANGDGIFAELIVGDDWGSGFVARGQVMNDSSSAISGWTLELTTTADIVNIWNATILSHDGDTYVIGDAGYNATVTAGGETGWGFQGAGSTSFTLSDVEIA